jgi:DNA polymerase
MKICLDIETYSDIDLTKSGVYKYASSDNFEILLLSYSLDGGNVVTVDLAQGGRIPEEIIGMIKDEKVQKFAFNAAFERVCLSKHLGLPCGEYLDPDSWFCDQVHASMLGLPLSLDEVGTVLGIENKKMGEGRGLISYFCKPCEPTKANGFRTRNLPHNDFDKYDLFKRYNARDVVTELEIHGRISKFPVMQEEWDNYHLSERINDLGIKVDTDFVSHAMAMDEVNSDEQTEKVKNITGVDNPNSPKQLKEWLVEQGIIGVESLSKKDVARLLEDATGNVEQILKLRQEIAKSSIKKYIAMDNVVCPDSRCRALFHFYGANRTGRFAGRLIQLQNLPQNHLENLDLARELVKEEDVGKIKETYGSLSQTLSGLIRTAFVPKEGCRFIVSDFSQVESRCLAFTAKEEWRLRLFEEGGDIYCQSASKMFGIKVEKNGENGDKRKYGKIAELACGYGGSVGALKAFGAVSLGIEEGELKGIISSWRDSNPHIVRMWWDVDKAAKNVIATHIPCSCYGLTISYEKGIMFIRLPSGRRLAYCKPRIGINGFGSECITYEGVGANHKWQRIESYGPKICENVIQAIARDLLCEGMKRVWKAGFRIVMHVHDEIVCEVPLGVSSGEEIAKLMSVVPDWYKGMPLKADSYECMTYRKE